MGLLLWCTKGNVFNCQECLKQHLGPIMVQFASLLPHNSSIQPLLFTVTVRFISLSHLSRTLQSLTYCNLQNGPYCLNIIGLFILPHTRMNPFGLFVLPTPSHLASLPNVTASFILFSGLFIIYLPKKQSLQPPVSLYQQSIGFIFLCCINHNLYYNKCLCCWSDQ